MRSNVTIGYRAKLVETGTVYESTYITKLSDRSGYKKEIEAHCEVEGFPVRDVKIISVSLGWRIGK